MNVHMKTMMRCVKFQSSKKLSSNVEEGAENVTKTTSSRIDKKNENSPKSCREYGTPNNYSTPIRQKPNSDNAKVSPNLNYSSNAILLPCTQDGSNEVAWDWQNTPHRTPNSRSNKQIVKSETPKGTRLFQRKRNSDSPLLSKPFKRKSIKMENIEHIGQFAAELQALSKKVIITKQSNQNYLEDRIEEEPTTVCISNNNKAKSSVVDNKENCTIETNIINKRSPSYDDLFDDSIDDSMARCTQEIEEKLNLIVVKGSSTVYPQPDIKTDIKKEKLSPTNNTTAQISTVQSKESSVATSTKNLIHEDTNSNSTLRMNSNSTSKINSDSTLKTYSKLSLKKDGNSSVHVPAWKDKNLHKVYLNNNMVHYDTETSCDDKKSKDKVVELFDFPDDSFDDCLATCLEDDELLSTPIKSSSFSTPIFESSYKNLTHGPLKGKPSYNSTASKVKVETSSTDSLDNRKFFKSKSLSDRYIGQNSTTNYKSTTYVTLPSYPAKSASHLNSTSKNPAVSYSTSVPRTSVSTNSIPTNGHRKIEDNANSLTPSADQTLGSDVNRSTVKEGGNRFVKYNSTGNMRNGAKEATTDGLLPVRCTAEEIEKKRLQAIMRLEAKRKSKIEENRGKLYALKIKNNINR